MNVQEELERMLLTHLSAPDAQKASEAMKDAKEKGSKATATLANGRVFSFESPFSLSISTPLEVGEPSEGVIDFTCSGESAHDQEKIKKAFSDAVKQRLTTFTIVTAKNLYFIHRWQIAGSFGLDR